MKYPIREKYLDEQLGVWFVFGIHPDGTVDISDGTSDVVTGVPLDVAERLVAAHDVFKDALYVELCKGDVWN